MTRRVLIDADGCPVVDEAVLLAKRFDAECLILCDTSHRFEKARAEVQLNSQPDRNALLGVPFYTQADAISLMCSERIGGRLTYTEQYRKGY